MKLIIDKNEYWIKDDVILPSNFNSMDDPEKWTYIIDNKLIHREEEPAAIYSNGTKIWFLNGLCHRLDGPATIYSCGYKEWYLNGIHVNEEVYKKIENSSKEELLMYAVLLKYKNYISLIEYKLDTV